jgi:hypothetical protein
LNESAFLIELFADPFFVNNEIKIEEIPKLTCLIAYLDINNIIANGLKEFDYLIQDITTSINNINGKQEENYEELKNKFYILEEVRAHKNIFKQNKKIDPENIF